MEFGKLFHVFRQNLCPEDNSEYNRHWYDIEVYTKKDNGDVIHALKSKEFTIIPEKNRYILSPSGCREIPQNIKKYDKDFDKDILNFLDYMDKKTNNNYKLFNFDLKDEYTLPFVNLEVYCHLNKDDIHFIKLFHSDLKIELYGPELKNVGEFLNLLNKGAFELGEHNCLTIERKLLATV